VSHIASTDCINPNSAKAYAGCGSAKYKLGDVLGAIIEFQKAVNLFKQQDDIENYNIVTEIIEQLLGVIQNDS